MYKIGVVGDHDSIFGFAALGFDIFPTDSEGARDRLKDLVDSGYGVIYITEKLAAESKDVIDRYESDMLPAIIKIPGVTGNTGDGTSDVRKSVEKAVGSDIVFGSEE